MFLILFSFGKQEVVEKVVDIIPREFQWSYTVVHSMLMRIKIKGERPDQRHPRHQRLYIDHMGLQFP